MKSRRILSIIGLTLAAVLLLGIGFAIGRNDEKKTVLVAPTESTAPRLIISAVHADSEYTSEKIQQTNDGTSDLDFCCIGLTDVTIDLGGNVMDLGNALREGKTSLSEISFLAQSDSQSGFCTEGWKSKNGLAEFRYSYPDFDLWIVDDIYETPDGLQHLIRGITLCQPGSDVAFLHNELDQEDWGIEFSVAEASQTEITLNYTQSGGQVLGQLMTYGYAISRLNPMEGIALLDNAPLQEQKPISMNGQGTLCLDIETYFGALPAGQYGMYLYLQDAYNEEDVPPLTRNYHDVQCYWIEFTVS
ncbi:MAG: hypothetical protein ACLTR8_05675 [Oscillospiraceae bacterium]|jgi:hypothetical protein|nr:hypothetical protein [Oscillospiraceae bacterium]MEE1456425.1 hypothetical protein [Oscillospiraceae bacterium]